MNNIVKYLKAKLDLLDFKLVGVSSNKILIFRCYYKYTKCIYINLFEDCISINIDKVFDSKYTPPSIERLLLSTKVFTSIDDSLIYIQKNITS